LAAEKQPYIVHIF